MLLFGHTASTNGPFLLCDGYLCNALLPSGVKVVSKALMGARMLLSIVSIRRTQAVSEKMGESSMADIC